MLKTGDEMRASARERNRKHRAKLAEEKEKHPNQVRIMQFIITIRLPVISIRKNQKIMSSERLVDG